MGDGLAVVEVGVVKVIVAPEIGCLSDPAAAVCDYGLKAAVKRSVRVVVAQMPLAEHAGAIAGVGKDIGHGHFGPAQDRSAPAGCPGAVADRATAGHEGAARRGAQGRDVEVAKAGGDRMEGVDRGGGDPRDAGASQVAVPLVVGDYDDNVGFHCHPFSGSWRLN